MTQLKPPNQTEEHESEGSNKRIFFLRLIFQGTSENGVDANRRRNPTKQKEEKEPR